jgi:hypothetical protein
MGNKSKKASRSNIEALGGRQDDLTDIEISPTVDNVAEDLKQFRSQLEKIYPPKEGTTGSALREQVVEFCRSQKLNPSVIAGLKFTDSLLDDKVFTTSQGKILMCAKLGQYKTISVQEGVKCNTGFPSTDEQLEDPFKEGELDEKLGLQICKNFAEMEKAATNFISENAENSLKLLAKLGRNEGALQEVGIDTLKGCSLTFSPLAADTHGNIPPTRVAVRSSSGVVEIVCKSRQGLADKAVTDTFKKINDAGGIDGKGTKLPCYDQTTLDDGSLVSQYVSGFHPDKDPTFMENQSNTLGFLESRLEAGETTLERFGHPEVDLKSVVKSGQALAVFALSTGLNDLHVENVVCTSDELVPIDLESFDFGEPGGCLLYQPGKDQEKLQELLKTIPISKEAQKAIDEFKLQLQQLPRRVVPIKTSVLKGMIGDGKTKDILVGLANKFGEEKFTLLEDAARPYIEGCISGQIVPMFTVQGNAIYSGVDVKEDAVIATRDG